MLITGLKQCVWKFADVKLEFSYKKQWLCEILQLNCSDYFGNQSNIQLNPFNHPAHNNFSLIRIAK